MQYGLPYGTGGYEACMEALFLFGPFATLLSAHTEQLTHEGQRGLKAVPRGLVKAFADRSRGSLTRGAEKSDDWQTSDEPWFHRIAISGMLSVKQQPCDLAKWILIASTRGSFGL
jgi:hypothetical protein